MKNPFFQFFICYLLSVSVFAQTTTIANRTYTSGQAATEVGPTAIVTSGAVKVDGGANVTFEATTSIKLEPGATVLPGAKFQALMNPNAALLPVTTSAASATGTLGSAFSFRVTASNSPSSFSATGLPVGLSLSSSTGYITGTPDSFGTHQVNLTITNAYGSYTSTLTLNIQPWSANASPSSAAIGATAGELNVDKSGALNYSVPIWTTPGTAGMEPKVSLNYSSQGGNGIAGFGWSVSGISAITRGGQTIAIDGQNRGATLTANDRFYLDGQRLMLISGTSYGAANSEYRTELDSFTKVIAYGSSGSGPAYFKAWTKAGLIIEFGNTADSARGTSNGATEKIGWSANRISDTKGNYMDFVYTQSSTAGTQILSRINYTGNGSVLPYASLRFEYESRPDSTVGYAFGSVMASLYRLTAIKSYFGETIARTYTLGYTARDYTQRSLLTSLTETGQDGLSYPPLTFNYGTPSYGWEQPASNFSFEPVYPLADNQGSGYPTGTGFVDLNGDGRVDFVVKRDGTGGEDRASLNTGTGWVDSTAYKLPYPLAVTGTSADTGSRFVDFDGDGLVDYVSYKLDANGNQVQRQSWRNTGSGWTPASAWLLPAPVCRDGTTYSKYGGRFIDVNGDGRPDYVAFLTTAGGQTNLAVYLNNGAGWTLSSGYSPTSFNLPGNSKLADYQPQFVDLNGDGLPDIVVAYKNGTSVTNNVWLNNGNGWTVNSSYILPTYISENNQARIGAEFVDMNGDGLIDLVWSRETPTVESGYALNTGTGWATSSSGSFSMPAELGRQNYLSGGATFMDFNADGLPDILMSRNLTGTDDKSVHFGTTRDWQPATDTTWNLPGTLLTAGVTNVGVNFVDFDGDGATDVVWKRWNFDGTLVKSVWRNKANPLADRLSSVTNGFGVTASVSYKSLLNPAIYTKGTGSTYPVVDLAGPMYVVDTVNNDDGVGGQYPITYQYANLRSDALRGNLGFEKMTVTDGRTQIVSTSTFSQVYPFIGMPVYSSTKTSAGGSLLSESIIGYDQKSLNGGATKFVFATSSTSRSWDLDGTQTGETITTIAPADIDTDGNVLVITVASTNLPATTKFTKVTTSVYEPTDTANWVLGRLKTASVKSSDPSGNQITRNSSFTYYTTNGLLNTETVEASDDTMALTTTYEYDGFGNKTKATSSGAKLTVDDTTGNYSASGTLSRVTSTTYDTNGRFPLSTTNALNHTENYTGYDQVKGVLTAMTGANSLPTSWSYDGFGRKIQENRADGTHSYTRYRWAPSTAPTGAKYFVETQSDGSAPSTAFYDSFGRAFLGLSVNGDGRIVYQETQYDDRGRAFKKSNPYYKGATIYWTTTTSYDLLNRPITVTTPDDENGTSTTTFSYNGLSSSITDPKLRKSTTTKNAQDWTLSVTRNVTAIGGAPASAVSYTYDPLGNLKTTVAAGTTTTLKYDIRGRKIQMIDADMGTWNYCYNVFGELIWQKDAKGKIVKMDYDGLGRLTSRVEEEGTTTWTYDTASGKGVGKLASVTGPGSYSESYTYDSLGRPSASTRTIADLPDNTTTTHAYTMSTTYDTFGRPLRTNYPASGIGSTPIATRSVYNSFGYLQEIRNYLDSDDGKAIGQFQGKLYWAATHFDVSGRIDQDNYGNGLSNSRTFSAATGRMSRATSLHAATVSGPAYYIQDLNYSYDRMGNVKSRIEAAPGAGRNEYFSQTDSSDGYDGLDRLLIHRVNGGSTVTVSYATNGNIASKSDAGGAYTYSGVNAGPHAVTSAGLNSYWYDADGNMTSVTTSAGTTRALDWTTFNQVKKITTGSNSSEFSFGAGHERVKEVRKNGSAVTDTTIFVGSLYEKVTTTTGNIEEHKYCIIAPTGRIAVYTQSKANATIQADTIRYFHTDGLGSITGITDETGTVLKRYAYDAWGKQSTLYTASGTGITNQAPSTRGFTDHEMLADHGLIHMNGRVYDPTLGRFISADPNVDGVSDAQGYNRYSYVGNNPLGATDPTGFFSLKDVFKIVAIVVLCIVTAGAAVYAAAALLGQAGVTFGMALGAVIGTGSATLTTLGAVIAGAAGGFAAGFAGSLLNGGSLGDAFKAGVIGGIVGGITGGLAHGIGENFGPIGKDFDNEFGRALAHGAVGGAIEEARGGQFRNGFYSSFAGSAAGSITPYLDMGTPGDRDLGRTALRTSFAAVVGGTTSVLGGGKFANGATTAAFQHLFNAEMHHPLTTDRPTLSEGQKYAIGIRSSRMEGIGYGYGHVNLAYYDGVNDTLETRALWPDSNQAIIDAGLSNGSGSDVRVNFAGDMTDDYVLQYWVVVDKATYDTSLKTGMIPSIFVRPEIGCAGNTCANWAPMVFKMATNVTVKNTSWMTFGKVADPMVVGQWIWDTNNKNFNNRANPAVK